MCRLMRTHAKVEIIDGKDKKKYVSDKDLAVITSIPRNSWIDLRRKNVGPPIYKINRRVLYCLDEVFSWIASHRQKVAANIPYTSKPHCSECAPRKTSEGLEIYPLRRLVESDFTKRTVTELGIIYCQSCKKMRTVSISLNADFPAKIKSPCLRDSQRVCKDQSIFVEDVGLCTVDFHVQHK